MPSAILRKLEENVGGMGKIRVVLRVANSGSSPTRSAADEESLRKHFQVSYSREEFPYLLHVLIQIKAKSVKYGNNYMSDEILLYAQMEAQIHVLAQRAAFRVRVDSRQLISYCDTFSYPK